MLYDFVTEIFLEISEISLILFDPSNGGQK